MKLIEILPEIEKGKRFSKKGWAGWYSKDQPHGTSFAFSNLWDDDWVLEEERKVDFVQMENIIIRGGDFEFIGGKLLTTREKRAIVYAIHKLLKEFEEELK